MPETKINIRPIEAKDNPDLKYLIETVMPEFGACGEGFAILDPEVQSMFEAYNKDRHSYFVLEKAKKVIGGCGLAPLKGAENKICELQKMYFLKEARGLGLGSQLIELCINKAQEFRFKGMYIETLTNMDAAQSLYLKYGFKMITKPMGNTGHFGCDLYYYKSFL